MKFLISILFLCLLSSCENHNDEISATFDNTGSVSFTVTDNEGSPLPGVGITIYNNYPAYDNMECSYYTADLVLSDSTDNNGKCEIENLLTDNYCYVVSAKKGRETFYVADSFSVAAGENIKIDEKNLFRNTRIVKFHIVDTNKIPIEGFNVAIYPLLDYELHSDYNFPPYLGIDDLNYVLSICNYKGKTDVNGDILFKLPMSDELNITHMPYYYCFYQDSSENTTLHTSYTYNQICMYYNQDTVSGSFCYFPKIELVSPVY